MNQFCISSRHEELSNSMIADYFEEVRQEYALSLRSKPDNEQRKVLLHKVDKLNQAYAKTFATRFAYQSKTLRNELLGDVPFEYSISDGVVAGDLLIERIWPKIMDRSVVITEAAPFAFLKERVAGFNSIKDTRLNFIEDIQAGESLQQVIDTIKKNPNIDMLVGIGGGRPMDILKFIGLQTRKKAVAFPTSLTSHVYASPKIHVLKPIKDLGYELTIDGNPSHLALLDLGLLEIINRSQPRLIRAGLGDIMAFYTARYDWRIAIKEGITEQNLFVEDVIDYIISVLESIDVEAPLRAWVQNYHLIQVLLCHVTDWVGSAPASGSEHLFALCAEEVSDTIPLHGELVALGSLIMSYMQGTDYMRIRKMIDRLGLPCSLSVIGLTKEQVIDAMFRCKLRGCKKNRYTIFEKIECTQKYFTKVIDYLLKNKAITL